VSRELDGGVTDIQTFAERRQRRPFLVKWVSAAAAVLIAAVSLPVLRYEAGPPADGFASLVSLKGTLGPGWDAHSWSATRGVGDGLSELVRGVSIGALTSTIEVAVAHGDSSVSGLASNIASLLMDVPGASNAITSYRNLANIHGAISLEQVRKARSGAREMVSKPAFDEGAWLEAARIAAVAHDSAFFRSKASRRQLNELVSATPADARTHDDVVALAQLVARYEWDAVAMRTSNIIALLTAP
jgi:hypothetical protein